LVARSKALRGDRTIDEFLIESAIAHQILLNQNGLRVAPRTSSMEQMDMVLKQNGMPSPQRRASCRRSPCSESLQDP